MPVYSYIALDTAGKRTKGVIEDESARSARTRLRDQALVPVEVTALAAAVTGGSARVTLRRIKASDYFLFCRLVGSLLDAGLELSEALQSAARQATPRAKPLYLASHAQVQQGQALSVALANVGELPAALSTAALAAGEKTGNVAQVLLAIADHAERRAELRGRITTALVYPAVLSIVALSVAIGLMIFVVPEVTRVFDGLRQELPWLTRAFIGISNALRDWGWVMLLAGTVASISLASLSRRPQFQRLIDRLTMRIPLVAPLRRSIQREQLLDTLAMLLSGGVPLVDALRGAGAVLNSHSARAAVLDIARNVEGGQPLDEAMQTSQLLSPVALQLVAAGVESARLDSMLARAAALEREQIRTRLALALALLEPLLIVMMGGFVLVLVIAILLPVFELNRLIA